MITMSQTAGICLWWVGRRLPWKTSFNRPSLLNGDSGETTCPCWFRVKTWDNAEI